MAGLSWLKRGHRLVASGRRVGLDAGKEPEAGRCSNRELAKPTRGRSGNRGGCRRPLALP